MRVFLAVFPPPAAQSAVFAVAGGLRHPGDGVSWVKQENLHYTLRFLGELGEDGARRAGEAAEEATRGVAAFDAALGTPGAFPNPRRARVLWVGLAEGSGPFAALAAGLDAALRTRGFGRPDHPFTPHLTIGRVRDPRADWTGRLAVARVDPAGARFRVERLCLVESRLYPKGSTYTILREAPLAAGGG